MKTFHNLVVRCIATFVVFVYRWMDRSFISSDSSFLRWAALVCDLKFFAYGCMALLIATSGMFEILAEGSWHPLIVLPFAWLLTMVSLGHRSAAMQLRKG
jgi:hypothetical protein